MWPFNKKKPTAKNVYKVTYIPCVDIDTEKNEVICQLSNMKEAYVEAESVFDAQKVFADTKVTKVFFSPHIYIDRITEVIHRTDEFKL